MSERPKACPIYAEFSEKMDVAEGCRSNAYNVSQSLVYKWRGDVRCAQTRTTHQAEERVFSEIVIEDDDPAKASRAVEKDIQIRSGNLEVNLPASYPVHDLAHLLLAPRTNQ